MNPAGPTNDEEEAHLRTVQGMFVQNIAALRGMLRSFISDPHRVDDVVQETFLTVTAKAPTYREDGHFRAWLFTIARHKLKESLRKFPAPSALSDGVVDLLMDEMPGFEDVDERLALLGNCMSQLAPKARTAIELRYHQGHLPPEIARFMGWSVGAVNVALTRARLVLRTCIERQLARAQRSAS